MTIKEKAELHRAGRLSDLQDTAQEMDMQEEDREASEALWEAIATTAGQSFKEGAVWSLKEILHAIEDAPEGSDICDMIGKKTIELLKGI